MAQSCHFVRKNAPKIIFKKLNSCILLTLRLESLQFSRARSNVLFEFEKNGKNYKNQFEY